MIKYFIVLIKWDMLNKSKSEKIYVKKNDHNE